MLCASPRTAQATCWGISPAFRQVWAGCHGVLLGCPWKPRKLPSLANNCPSGAFTCALLPSLQPDGCRLPTLDSRDGNRQPSAVWLRLPTVIFHSFNGCVCIQPKAAGESPPTSPGGCTRSKKVRQSHLPWSPSFPLFLWHLFPSPASLPQRKPAVSDKAESHGTEALAHAFAEIKKRCGSKK